MGDPGAHEGPGQRRSPPSDKVVEALVTRFSPAVYRLAASIVQDPALAEDVVQETFINVWKKASTYRGEAPLRHWILRIAHNVAVSTLRTLKEEARDPRSMPAPGFQGVEAHVYTRMAIQDALSRLDELSRSIVVLREVEGLGYEEIASVLKVSLPTVKTRLFRARRALAEVAEEWDR